MCGIVGFTGSAQAAPILLDGLSKLEYRGYDSAGLAVQNAAGKIEVVKAKGRLRVLSEMTDEGKAVQGSCGIGHTRWATHGEPSVVNAHPHYSRDQKIAVVHNGIIENYQELKTRLINKGFTFASQTDTEVVAQLLDYYYTGVSAGDSLDAITRMMMHVRGSYALGILFADQPGVVYAVRKDSPLIVGKAENGSLIASDVPALLKYTRTVYYIDNLEIARLTPDSIEFFNIDKEPVEKEASTIEWDAEAAEKGGYEHFMMKEIHEQPRVVRDTLVGRMTPAGELDIDELGLSLEELNDIDRVYVIACGTSYHAGLIAKNLIEGWARIPTEVEAASEFRYRNPIITPTTLVVAVSQSGETADTLAAIRDARIKGAKVFGITNVVGSPVARESDGVIYTKANKEIAVASTKSFIGQVVSLTLLALLLAQVKYRLTTKQARMLFRELSDTAEQIQWILDTQTEAVHEAALLCKDAQSALFVGRGMGAAISYEGALKLKEVSYLHAEAYAAGEMKHGPIALIDPGFPVIAVATKSATYDKTVSNLMECKARGAKVIVVATEGDEEINKIADCIIRVPAVRDVFSPITASVPLQLLAREVAKRIENELEYPGQIKVNVIRETRCTEFAK